MNLQQIIDKINNLEESIDIKTLNFIDFNPWPFIRLRIINELNKQDTKSVISKRVSIVDKAKVLFDSFVMYRKNPIKNEIIDIIYFTRKSELQDVVNQKLFNRYSDSFLYFFHDKYKIKVLETKDSNIDNITELENKNVTYLDFITKIARMKFKVLKLFFKEQTLPLYLTQTIKDTFGFELKIKDIQSELLYIHILAIEFEKILQRSNPKVVFLVCFYRIDAMAMSLACSRLNIKTVEYQHGAQNNNHVMYTNWLNIPKKGYKLIPDTFWMWGKVNKKRIDSWAGNTIKHKALVGGNLWLSYNKKDIITNNINRIENGKLSILVSLQGNKFISEFFIEFIEKFGEQYNWYFRDHPRIPISHELRDYFDRYSVENIDETTRRDLYDILKVVDVTITGFSTVAFEAQSFDKPTIFIHENAKEGFEDLLGKDGLYYAGTMEEIKMNLDNLNKKTKVNEYYIVSDEKTANEAIKEILV